MYQILEVCGIPGLTGCIDSSQKVRLMNGKLSAIFVAAV
jgi:hypothetical protein